MPSALRRPAAPGRAARTTVRLIPQDPQWLHDFYMTADLFLAPYHAAWAARQNGVDELAAPAFPPGLEDLAGLDAPSALDAWSAVHRAFPAPLRSRWSLRDTGHDPAHGSRLRAPGGAHLVPLHAVTVEERDLRTLERVRRTLRAAARTRPSYVLARPAEDQAELRAVAGARDYVGTLDRTVAVLTLAPDDDVQLLAAAVAPDRFGEGTRRVDLSAAEHGAYERFADRLAQAATTGDSPAERALFRGRY